MVPLNRPDVFTGARVTTPRRCFTLPCMSLSRPARVGLLLLLLLVAAGAYLYRNLDAILGRQVRATLLAYGVADYRLEEPRLAAGSFSARALWLRGNYGGHTYELTLESPEVRYDWRTLLTRRAQSVRLSGLDLAIERTGPAAPQGPGDEPVVIATGSLLPQAILAGLPVQALDIGDLRIAYRAPGLPDLLVTGKILYRDHLEATLHTALAGGDLSLAVTSGAEPSSVDSRLTLREGETPAARLSAQLRPADRDAWEWQVRGDWQFAPLLAWLRRASAATGLPPAHALPGGLVLAGSGAFDARVLLPDKLRLPFDRALAALPLRDASVHTVATLEQLDYPGVAVGLAGTVDATATLDGGRWRLALAPTRLSGNLAAELLGIPADTRGELQWGETVPVDWRNGEPLDVEFDGAAWTGRVRDTSLHLGNAQTRVAVENLALDTAFTPGQPPALETSLGAGIEFLFHRQPLPRLELKLAQQGTLAASKLDLKLADSAATLDAGLKGTLDLAAGSGQLELRARSDNLNGLSGAVLPVLRKSGMLPADLAIESGAFKLDTQLATAGYDPAQWRQTSHLSVTDVAGLYDEYRFDGLSITAGWKGMQEWQTLQPLTLSLGHLHAGIDITDIAARAALPRPTPISRPALSLEAFSAHLFGGEVTLPRPGTWDFGAASNSLTLRAEGWQLARIVAVQHNEDIRAQGVLEGELPVSVTGGRVVIDQGYLRALPPGGTIQYAADDTGRALGANNQELGRALNLLSDFRFEVLSSTVNLAPSGNLRLGLSLSGHNPEQYEGRKVNFNINLEQNLDPLLQSLRLSGKLTDKIENRLR